MEEKALRKAATELVVAAGYGKLAALQRVPGGSNNRVFRADTPRRTLLLKVYHRDDVNRRDRGRTEFEFTQFAWSHGIRAVPEPIVLDASGHLGVYAWVHGRRLTGGDVDGACIQQAIGLFTALNAHRGAAGAKELATASEARFSVPEHVQLVDERVERLCQIRARGSVDATARDLVDHALRPAWHRCRDLALSRARELGLEGELSSTDRCLSPSDFGFHNALLRSDGELVFHDFEYAGWDDPAKLVGDFFCQVQVPVPASQFAYFRDEIFRALGSPDRHRARLALLLPVFRIKWCCILLNDFVPADARRRRFARDGEDAATRKRQQLVKVEQVLSRLNEEIPADGLR